MLQYRDSVSIRLKPSLTGTLLQPTYEISDTYNDGDKLETGRLFVNDAYSSSFSLAAPGRQPQFLMRTT
jgi:hypothetical protein